MKAKWFSRSPRAHHSKIELFHVLKTVFCRRSCRKRLKKTPPRLGRPLPFWANIFLLKLKWTFLQGCNSFEFGGVSFLAKLQPDVCPITMILLRNFRFFKTYSFRSFQFREKKCVQNGKEWMFQRPRKKNKIKQN